MKKITLEKLRPSEIDEAFIALAVYKKPKRIGDIIPQQMTWKIIAIAISADPGLMQHVPERLIDAEHALIAACVHENTIAEEINTIAEERSHTRWIPLRLITDKLATKIISNYSGLIGYIPYKYLTVDTIALAIKNNPNLITSYPEYITESEAFKSILSRAE